MPKQLPAGLAASESKQSRQFLRLFKITLSNVSTTLRFVEGDLSYVLDVKDGSGAVQWGAAVGITRSAAEQNMDMKPDAATVTIPNQSLSIAGLGSNNLNRWAALGIFENAVVDMYVYDLDTASSALWSEWIIQGSPRWSYEEVSFQMESAWGQFDRQVPRTIIQEQCVAPDSKILMSDLTWKAAGDVNVGDELIGIDEFAHGGSQRKLRSGIVQFTGRRPALCVEVETDKGKFAVSEDHRFLSAGGAGRVSGWVYARDLRPGDEIKYLVKPWDSPMNPEEAFERGYISGMLDAEGSVSVPKSHGNRAVQVNYAQNPGPVWDRVSSGLRDASAWTGPYYVQRGGFKLKDGRPPRCQRLYVGGTGMCLRLLGMFRPSRLLAKAGRFWEGRALIDRAWGYRAIVQSVAFVGEREVVSLQTNIHTFVADGALGHNCNNKLFDRYCGLSKPDWTAHCTVAATPAPTRLAFAYTLVSSGRSVPAPVPDHWFELGDATFTTGAALAPIRRMVLTHASGLVSLASTLPFAPSVGDPVDIAAGCDKTAATCQSKFNNLTGTPPGSGGFRGYPYRPKPDVIYDV